MNLRNRFFLIVFVIIVTIFRWGYFIEVEKNEFKDYLGNDINMIDEADLELLESIYEEISISENNGDSNGTEKLWRDFDDILRENGLYVGYRDFNDFIRLVEKEIPVREYKEIVSTYKNIEELQKEIQFPDAEIELVNEWDKMRKQLGEYGYDMDEVLEDIDNGAAFIALYKVENRKIAYEPTNNREYDIFDESEKESHKLIWQKIEKIFPEEYIDRIVEYKVNTDGEDNLLAYVIAEDETNREWKLAVDIKDALDENEKIHREFCETLIHEFAHILTLNDEQISSNTSDLTYTNQDGSLRENSYLNIFYKKFWPDIYEAWSDEYMPSGNQEEDDEKTAEFFDLYDDQFISQYAATSPEEDIAESFMHFVIDDRPRGKTISEEKILFFYQFDELIRIREEIRGELR